MDFANSQALILLVLAPLTTVALLWGLRRRRRRLEIFGRWEQVARLAPSLRGGVFALRAVMWAGGCALLVLALARPKFGDLEETILARGVDVIIAVDTSASMLADDIQPRRIDRARDQVADLMGRLRGNRIGLMSFAGAAMLQCPLTLDQTILHQTLGIMDQHAVGIPGTNIAEAIRLAVRSYDQDSPRHRVLVLLTDGEDHTGGLDDAAHVAKEANVTIHAIGIGTASGSSVPQLDTQGNETGFKRKPDGSPVLSRLDTQSLLMLSSVTDGRAFEASGIGRREVDEIARAVQALPQKEMEEQRVTRKEEQFQAFLLPAIALLMLDLLLLTGGRRRRPRRLAVQRHERPRTAAAAAAMLLLSLAVAPFGRADEKSAAEPNNLGTAHHRSGEYQTALENYQRAQVEAPESSPISLNIGTLHYDQGNYDEAVRNYQSVVDRNDPNYAETGHYNLGTARIRRAQRSADEGDLHSAVEEAGHAIDSLREALLGDPSDNTAKTNLEMATSLRRRWNEQLNSQMQIPNPETQQQQDQQQQGQQDNPDQGQQQQDQQQGDQAQQGGQPQGQDQGQDQAQDQSSSQGQDEGQGQQQDGSQDQSQEPGEEQGQDQAQDQAQDQDSQQQPQSGQQQPGSDPNRPSQMDQEEPSGGGGVAPLSEQMAGSGGAPAPLTPAQQAEEAQIAGAEARLDTIPFQEYPYGMRNLLGVQGAPPRGGPDW